MKLEKLEIKLDVSITGTINYEGICLSWDWHMVFELL